MDDPGLQKALDLYKSNYVEYKVTGRVANKVAYENAQRTIENYLAGLQKNIEKDASYVDKFVADYANSNKKLMQLRDQSQVIHKQGPALQDLYEVQKRLVENPPQADYTPLYVKAGLIAGILGIAGVASMFR